MSRSLRRVSALLALFAMVFAQLAMAAHACPRMAAEARIGSAASNPAPCHQAPASHDAGSNLCHQHCQAGNILLDDAPPPAIAFDASAPCLRVAQLTPAMPQQSAMSRHVVAPSPPPPPLLLAVLRI